MMFEIYDLQLDKSSYKYVKVTTNIGHLIHNRNI